MTYKEIITEAMTSLAQDPDVCFVGYGVTRGKAMGTLAKVNPAQLIETPVAENLMVGLATGLALRGRKPVVFIERCDFLLNALDAIVNHLTKINVMSRGEFKPAIILRVVIGNRDKPLFTGETHTQDFMHPFDLMVNARGAAMVVKEVKAQPHDWFTIPYDFKEAVERLNTGYSTAFFERKDLY